MLKFIAIGIGALTGAFGGLIFYEELNLFGFGLFVLIGVYISWACSLFFEALSIPAPRFFKKRPPDKGAVEQAHTDGPLNIHPSDTIRNQLDVSQYGVDEVSSQSADSVNG